MTNVAAKLRESQFFLLLLERLESTGEALFPNFAAREEFSFVFCGLLNAFYAVTEHMKPLAGATAVKEFKKEHPLVFNSKSGLRNLAVHERHIAPALTKYVLPRGKAEISSESPAPTLAEVAFRAEYYVEPGGDPLHIGAQMKLQYAALCEFASGHGIAIDA